MTESSPTEVRAYLNWGRWVADCATPGCSNALALELGQRSFTCRTRNGAGSCGVTYPVAWPADPAASAAAVEGLPESERSTPLERGTPTETPALEDA